MPVRCRITGRVVRVELAGTYPPEDIVTACDRIVSQPEFPANAVLLLDVRESEELTERPADDVRRVAEAFVARARLFGGRCAMLAGTTAQFGMARMGSAFAEAPGVQVEVFTSEEDAVRWLLEAATP